MRVPLEESHPGNENMAVAACWNTLNSHSFRNLQLQLTGILRRKYWHSVRGAGGCYGFFTLFWLRVSDTPPKNSRKSTNQNSMKSEWTGEKINIYIYTYKTVPPKSAQKTNYCHWTPKKKQNCAGGWDLITFKKPYSYKESRENKRAARWARSSICCSWVPACWRQWLPFHWGLQTGMMDEGICHTQGLVLSVPPASARSGASVVIQTNDNKPQWDTSSSGLRWRERLTKDLTREPRLKKKPNQTKQPKTKTGIADLENTKLGTAFLECLVQSLCPATDSLCDLAAEQTTTQSIALIKKVTRGIYLQKYLHNICLPGLPRNLLLKT